MTVPGLSLVKSRQPWNHWSFRILYTGPPMFRLVRILAHGVVAAVKDQRDLALENVALRHQITVLKRQAKKPTLGDRDRMFWTFLKRFWPKWEQALALVSRETVLRWPKKGVREFWRRKSSRRTGRSSIDPEVRKLIRAMWTGNPTWGRPRIHAELAGSTGGRSCQAKRRG